ncbi:ATP-binding protein [Streptomyces sp. NPDC046685]|uniref:ATP-binding protein n=1 Tax=Streptomyces sp. NPDC046685 TaxID=3157202 RepID=UPI0033F141CD
MLLEPSGIGDPAYSQNMPRQPESARTARHLTASALHVWGLDEAADSAAAVVTELVSNAVRHARRDTVQVKVTRAGDRLVRIAVTDFSRDLPEPRHAAMDAVTGRGLAIVAALCDGRWGADPLRWGKTVWAELAVPEAKPDE